MESESKVKKKRKNRNNRPVQLLHVLLGISYEELLVLVKKIKPEDVKFLQLRFGKNFDEVKEIKDNTTRMRIYRIINKLKKLKEDPSIKINPKEGKLLHEILGCTKTYTKKLIKLLRPEDVKLLQLRFGKNFDEVIPIKDNTTKIRIFRLVNKLKILKDDPSIIIVHTCKLLHELLGCTKEQLKEALKYLREDEIQKLKKGYGENLDEYIKISAKERAKEIRPIVEFLRHKIRNPNARRRNESQTLIDLLKCTEEQFKIVVSQLTEKELNILRQRYGYNLDEVIPTNDKTLMNEAYSVVNTMRRILSNPDLKRRKRGRSKKETKVSNDSDLEKNNEELRRVSGKKYHDAIKELQSIPFAKDITVSSFKVENKKAISNLYGGMANVVVSRIANNHTLIKSYTPRKRQPRIEKTEEYIQAIKEVRDIPFAREIIVSSLKIKNKNIAFMLYGLSSVEGELTKEPQFPNDIAAQTDVSTREIEKMRNCVSLGVLRRVKRSQVIIVNYEAKQISEEQVNPEGGRLVKKPSHGKQANEKTSEN